MRVWVPKWVQRRVEESEAQTFRSGLSSGLGRGALEERPVGARIECTQVRAGLEPGLRRRGRGRPALQGEPPTAAASVYVDRRDHPAIIALPSPKAPQAGGPRPRGLPQPPPPASSSVFPGVQLNEARAGSNPISSAQGRRLPPAPAAIRTATARAGVGQVKRDQFAPGLYQQVA